MSFETMFDSLSAADLAAAKKALGRRQAAVNKELTEAERELRRLQSRIATLKTGATPRTAAIKRKPRRRKAAAATRVLPAAQVISPRTGQPVTVRRRAVGQESLAQVVLRVLQLNRPHGMNVPAVTKAVCDAGYKSGSKNFSQVVGVNLSKFNGMLFTNRDGLWFPK